MLNISIALSTALSIIGLAPMQELKEVLRQMDLSKGRKLVDFNVLNKYYSTH